MDELYSLELIYSAINLQEEEKMKEELEFLQF